MMAKERKNWPSCLSDKWRQQGKSLGRVVLFSLGRRYLDYHRAKREPVERVLNELVGQSEDSNNLE